VSAKQQRQELDLLSQLNQRHANASPDNSELAARIASYELAFRMQAHAPEAVDLSRETEQTKRLYGLDNPKTERFGRRCLLARRLVERGVRFVQVYSGGGHNDENWDAHTNVNKNHELHCGETDQPIAALLTDLKSRGLLDSTLIVWAGEFGRTPTGQNGKGRDHSPRGFSSWLAGGGVKGGQIIGATDEFGYAAVENKVHVHDLHATILHLMGMDHTALTYFHGGRDMRLTDVSGKVVKEVLA
jgi:membrane-anchored protein YejM (alkaline phosphatase superfamily)